VNANQVFAWRRLYRQGLLENANGKAAGLLAVRVVETPPAVKEVARPKSEEAQRTLGMIQVELPKGHLRIAGRVDGDALRVVLEKLLGSVQPFSHFC
jgi:transposase